MNSDICLNSVFRSVFLELWSLVVAGISKSQLHRYDYLMWKNVFYRTDFCGNTAIHENKNIL